MDKNVMYLYKVNIIRINIHLFYKKYANICAKFNERLFLNV